MVVDFSRVDTKDPTIILRTKSGTPLGVLGYANNIICEVCFNEISRLSFNIPAYVDGIKTPYYEDVIGMRVLDLKDVGQFILMNPKISNNGISEIKECTAYSLEVEFTYKKLSLENATYNFWNPVARGGTILGIIMERMPSWSVGKVDSDLIGRYRTFDLNDENLYNFIKSTVQETYQCVFEFNPYNRVVNVRSVKSIVATQPVYISFDNLIKEAEIAEDSENIVTCLAVSGADGVDIRSVNPMGSNKIYNLSYFMNTTNFSQQTIERYTSWKNTFEAYQLQYFNLSVESALRTTEWLTENAMLTDLYGRLKDLENQQAVTIQAIAQKLQTQSNLDTINSQISIMKSQINTKKNLLNAIDDQIISLNNKMVVINNATSFTTFFSQEELLVLDKYIKEDSISDSSFVAPAVKNFNTADTSEVVSNASYSITGSTITRVVNSDGRDMYNMNGGTLNVSTGIPINAEVIRASYMVGSDRNFLFTAYFRAGTIKGSPFPSGCISLTGAISGTTSSDVAQDPTLPEIFRGTRVSFTVSSARFYFTQNTTMYEQRSVEWDLYDFGKESLERLSTPSYTFDVGMADFLSAEEFESFKNSVELGSKVYLNLNDNDVIQPISVKCVLDFSNHKNFKFEFGNTYKVIDSEFRLLDLLNQSISMGSRVDSKQFTYNAWVESGAETSVSQFLTNALDVAKNAILSSRGQAPTLDETGLRIRKRLENDEYDPRQMWAVSNSLMFTSDNWNTAELAIGEFVDDNAGTCWGIVAKMIVGTLIAGNNLIIESAKKDGGVSVFRVDGDGAALYNATFNLFNGANTQITLNPFTGFAIGRYPLYSGNGYTINTTNAQFWVDMDGNVHMKGTLHGVNGTFSGELAAATGRFKGIVQASDYQDLNGISMLSKNSGSGYKFDADFLDLKGISITDTYGRNSFSVNRSGYVKIGDGSNQITYDNFTGILNVSGRIAMGSGSSITWGDSWGSGGVAPPTAAQVGAIADKEGVITSTYIAEDSIQTAHIKANAITAKMITAWEVEGVVVRAGRYYNTAGNAYLSVSTATNNQFSFMSSRNQNLLEIRDPGVGRAQLATNGYLFLEAMGGVTSTLGSWTFNGAVSFGSAYTGRVDVNFSYANVSGLPSTTATWG